MTPEQALTRICNRLQTFLPQNEIGQDIARGVDEECDIIRKAITDGEQNAAALETIKAEQKAKGQGQQEAHDHA